MDLLKAKEDTMGDDTLEIVTGKSTYYKQECRHYIIV